MRQRFNEIQERGSLDSLLHREQGDTELSGGHSHWDMKKPSQRGLWARLPLLLIPDLVKSLLLRVYMCLVNSVYSLLQISKYSRLLITYQGSVE